MAGNSKIYFAAWKSSSCCTFGVCQTAGVPGLFAALLAQKEEEEIEARRVHRMNMELAEKAEYEKHAMLERHRIREETLSREEARQKQLQKRIKLRKRVPKKMSQVQKLYLLLWRKRPEQTNPH